MGKFKFPASLNVLGREYLIEYKDKAFEVDVDEENTLWGQVDHKSGTIRVLKRPADAMFHTIFHEVLHAIEERLGLSFSDEPSERVHRELTTAVVDTLLRNGWIRL